MHRGLAIALGLALMGCSVIVDKERPPGECGDGILDPGEECDGDFFAVTCEDFNGIGSVGQLHCRSQQPGACTAEAHDCSDGGSCPNGVCELWEFPENCEDCNGDSCGDGVCDAWEQPQSCPQDCGNVDCGNTQLDGGEDCDGDNLAGQTCQTLGFHSGPLRCSAACFFDTSSCISDVGGPCITAADCITEECIPGPPGLGYCTAICSAFGANCGDAAQFCSDQGPLTVAGDFWCYHTCPGGSPDCFEWQLCDEAHAPTICVPDPGWTPP